jgi:hypothetical protein
VNLYIYFYLTVVFRRFIENEELFTNLVSSASQTQGVRTALGGNAPVMANRFHLEGCDVLLGAKMTSVLQKEIAERIKSLYNFINKTLNSQDNNM